MATDAQLFSAWDAAVADQVSAEATLLAKQAATKVAQDALVAQVLPQGLKRGERFSTMISNTMVTFIQRPNDTAIQTEGN